MTVFYENIESWKEISPNDIIRVEKDYSKMQALVKEAQRRANELDCYLNCTLKGDFWEILFYEAKGRRSVDGIKPGHRGQVYDGRIESQMFNMANGLCTIQFEDHQNTELPDETKEEPKK